MFKKISSLRASFQIGKRPYYSNYEEFKLCLDELVSNKSLRDTLGSQGRKYGLSNYSWPRVEEEYRKSLTQIAGKASGLTESETA